MFQWTPPGTNQMTDLAPFLKPFLEKTKFPAIAAAVVQSNNIAAAGVVGIRKFGEETPAELTDKFHLGSCTKSMTALLAVMLAEQGKISLDATPRKILGWEVPEDKSGITLELLLQNRGGFPTQAPPDLWQKAWSVYKGSPTEIRTQFLRELLKKPLAATPGEKEIYSNQGFALAGAMLEKAAGKPWEELIREYVFKPLGLKSAGFGSPVEEGHIDQPWGHQRRAGEIKVMNAVDNPVAIAPAGAVHCSILDFARYAAFHMALARGEVPQLASWKDELYTPPAWSDYALGWMVVDRSWAQGKAMTHAGSNTAYIALVWIAPARNTAFVVAANAGDSAAPGDADKVIAALIQKFLR